MSQCNLLLINSKMYFPPPVPIAGQETTNFVSIFDLRRKQILCEEHYGDPVSPGHMWTGSGSFFNTTNK